MTEKEPKKNETNIDFGRMKWLLSLSGVLMPILLILVLELVLRLFGGAGQQTYDDPFVGFEGSPSLYVRQGEVFRTRQSRLAWFNDVKFSSSKPADVFRVFTMGGSTTYGRPYDNRASFSKWLELLLAQGSAKPVEVINAGGVSYASYRVAKIWEEVLQYEPDLLVLYTGHNEFLEERTYQNILTQPEWVQTSRGWLSRLLLFRWLRSKVYAENSGASSKSSKQLLAEEVETRLDRWQGMDAFQRENLQIEPSLTHFETNLRRMMRLAKDAGVPVLVISPASNQRDFSPFKSQFSPDLDASSQMAIQQKLESGKAAMERQAYQAAKDAFEEAVSLDQAYAASWYYLGRSLLEIGAGDKASEALQRALVEDVCPLRARPAFIDVLRRVSKEEGVDLIDLVQILAEQAAANGDLLAGDRFFLDHVHPRIAVHQQLARSLASTVFEKQWLTGSLPSQEWQQKAFAEVEAGFDQAYMAEMEMNLSRVLGWAGKIDEASKALERSLAAGGTGVMGLFQAGLLAEKQSKWADAMRAYSQVIESDPRFMPAHLNMGRVLRAQGDLVGALASLERAKAISPDESEIYLALAGTQMDAGLLDEAEQSLERLEKVSLDIAGFEVLKARLLRLRGQLSAAETLLRNQVKRFPAAAGSHFDLAVVHGEMGALDKAESGFKRALELEPQMAEAWRNLGEIYLARKAYGDALAAFERALSIEPNDNYGHSRLGDVHRLMGQLTRAEAEYRLALETEANDSHSLVNLGLIRAQAGDLNEGIALLERALEIGEGDGTIHYNMAQLLLAARREAEARGHLLIAKQRGVELKPELEALLGGGR